VTHKPSHIYIDNGKVSPLRRHYGMHGSVKGAIVLLPGGDGPGQEIQNQNWGTGQTRPAEKLHVLARIDG
jgi:hypothetical protein